MTYGATWPEVAAVGQEIDRLGYDFLLMHDHLLATQGDLYQPFFESYTTLGAWAVLTKQVHLGHLTVGNPFRNPGVVAKATATLDHITNGRMTLVLGAGSLPEEFPLHGLAVGQSLGDRLRALDESLSHRDPDPGRRRGQRSTRRTTTWSASSTARGRSSRTCRSSSVRPARRSACGSPRKYADYWQMSVDPSTSTSTATRRRSWSATCADLGRDRRTITRLPEGAFIIRETREEAEAVLPRVRRATSSGPTKPGAAMEAASWSGTSEDVVESLRPFRDAGIDGVILQPLPPYDFETIRRLATEVAPALG